jgi:hypothetical protein
VKTLTVVFLFFAVFLMTGCDDSGTNTSSATLTGTAHVLGNTTPVPGATVNAQGRTTQTDNNGNFRIDNLAPGSTTVTITKAGFKVFTATVDLPAGSIHFSFAIEPE